MKSIIAAVLIVFWLGGCTSPGFIIAPMKDEPSLFVGLAGLADRTTGIEPQHDHPVEWTTGDLQAILKRLAVQEGSGLMDFSRTPQVIFSPDELTHLIPAVQKAFAIARSSDWVVFAVWGASNPSQVLEVTSGGMFLKNRALHILLANHRERVSSETNGIQAIRKNPFHVLREVKRSLLFYPTSYIVESRKSWITGGFDSPVSELILDYQALLATELPNSPTVTQESGPLDLEQPDSAISSSTTKELQTLQEEINTLKDELSRLRQQINRQPSDSPQTKAP